MDLSKYTEEYFSQKKRPINNKYELQKEIAGILKKPVGMVMKMTAGWGELKLAGCIEDSLHYQDKYNKPAAMRCWNILKNK